MTIKELASFKATIEHLLFVTHAVPAQRVRPLVPDSLELDIVKGPEGEDTALVSASCFLNRRLHWAMLETPSLDFHQSTYRTYVKQNDQAGAYFFGTFIERATPFILERLAMRNAYQADFDVSLAFDADTQTYRTYYCEILSEEGDTIIEVRSGENPPAVYPPFNSADEMADFITCRPIGYFPMTLAPLGSMKVQHAKMSPVIGELLAGQFDLWEELGIVYHEESESPYSVLIQPSIDFTGYPPTPIT